MNTCIIGAAVRDLDLRVRWFEAVMHCPATGSMRNRTPRTNSHGSERLTPALLPV